MTDQATTNTPDEQAAPLTFIPWLEPPLPSGTHSILVEQSVTLGGPEVASFSTRQNFLVSGERYRLAATTLNSLSPEHGACGDFSSQLPHVVLNNASLPWQRSPYPAPPAPAKPGDVERRASWLAVLLFDESDPPPKPRESTTEELVNDEKTLCGVHEASASKDKPPSLTLIDVDLALFNAIAPSLRDLELNAHVRRVDPRNKASQGKTLAPSDYAVVVGNRLPALGHASVAHLVSLEGLAGLLPADDGAPGKGIKPGTRQIRLVSLASWSFNTRTLSEEVSDRLGRLDPAPLQMPLHGEITQDPGDQAILQAFGLGYTAMNHRLRNGEHSVSWYRGPLLPVAGNTPEASGARNPDSLLRYDPDSGMFDVSYSAAWQLGRLLALQNNAFASALYRWKLNHTQEQLEVLEQQRLERGLQQRQSGTTEAPMMESLDLAGGGQVKNALTGILGAAISNLQDRLTPGEP